MKYDFIEKMAIKISEEFGFVYDVLPAVSENPNVITKEKIFFLAENISKRVLEQKKIEQLKELQELNDGNDDEKDLSPQKAAIKKLQDLGIYDENVQLTPEYQND